MSPTTPAESARVDPVKLTPESRFQFRCHPGVSCFTQCCRGINILLTPYDVICLKKRLELTSEEFLAIYTQPHLLEKTDLPVVSLKLLDDEKKSCPFVRDDGCILYRDRPTTCRYYPLGVASLSHRAPDGDNAFFFMIKEPHCRGFEEQETWTVADWRKDQGVDIRDEINAEWTDLLVRKRSFPPHIRLTEQAKQMFFMVSYNLDKFRRFVTESSFLTRYPVDAETLERIRKSDVELLKFGLGWLKSVLFNTERLGQETPRQDAPDVSGTE